MPCVLQNLFYLMPTMIGGCEFFPSASELRPGFSFAHASSCLLLTEDRTKTSPKSSAPIAELQLAGAADFYLPV